MDIIRHYSGSCKGILNESGLEGILTSDKVMDDHGRYWQARKGCTDEMFVVRQPVQKTIQMNKQMPMQIVRSRSVSQCQ